MIMGNIAFLLFNNSNFDISIIKIALILIKSVTEGQALYFWQTKLLKKFQKACCTLIGIEFVISRKFGLLQVKF